MLSDRQVVQGEAIVLSVYCPDKLADIQDRIDDLGRYYLGAAIALGLQLLFWSWALATNIS